MVVIVVGVVDLRVVVVFVLIVDAYATCVGEQKEELNTREKTVLETKTNTALICFDHQLFRVRLSMLLPTTRVVSIQNQPFDYAFNMRPTDAYFQTTHILQESNTVCVCFCKFTAIANCLFLCLFGFESDFRR